MAVSLWVGVICKSFVVLWRPWVVGAFGAWMLDVDPDRPATGACAGWLLYIALVGGMCPRCVVDEVVGYDRVRVDVGFCLP